MTTTRPAQILTFTALAAISAILTSCAATSVQAQPRPTPSSPSTKVDVRDYAPGDIVWQVDGAGGFIPMDVVYADLPEVTVYGDGRIIVSRYQDTFVPGLTHDVQVGQLDDEQLAGVVQRALDSGLFGRIEPDLGTPNITDLGSTTVTLLTPRGDSRQVSPYALGYEDETGDLSDGQLDRRDRLQGLIDASRPPGVTLQGYLPEQVAVTRVSSETHDGGQAVTWPGPPIGRVLTHMTTWGACGVVSGPAAAQVYDAAKSNEDLRWRDGDETFYAVIRPVLPGQVSCPR